MGVPGNKERGQRGHINHRSSPKMLYFTVDPIAPLNRDAVVYSGYNCPLSNTPLAQEQYMCINLLIGINIGEYILKYYSLIIQRKVRLA